jgi:ribosome-associated protein YbcJ (S4-like RNA binding protein)
MKLYEIESNGEKFIFNVIKNTTEACPECGVPACGKEDILWFEENEIRTSIIFDGGYFDIALEEYFIKNSKSINNESLPVFLKEWQNSTGWEESWDYNGHQIEINDFLKSLDLIKTSGTGKWLTEENITDMEKLAFEAKEKGKELKIVRG